MGLKVTVIAQLAPALTAFPQLLVCEKSPLATMLDIASDWLPKFDSVIVCEALVVPTNCAANVTDVIDKLASGARAATATWSFTLISSLSVSATVADGAGGGSVLAPEPFSPIDCVKFEPAAVLVRLLSAALSVNVMVPVGAPEGGARYAMEKMQAPAAGRSAGRDVAPLVHSVCTMLNGDGGEVTASRDRLTWPRLEMVRESVCDWPPKPRLPTE